MGEYYCIQNTSIGMTEEISLKIACHRWEFVERVCVKHSEHPHLKRRIHSHKPELVRSLRVHAGENQGGGNSTFYRLLCLALQGWWWWQISCGPSASHPYLPTASSFFFLLHLNGSYFALCCVTPTEYFSSAVSLFLATCVNAGGSFFDFELRFIF